MRAIVQRVTEASVTVGGNPIAQIGPGIVVLLGIAETDGSSQAREMAHKLANLRILADQSNRMNRSIRDTGGSILVVSQFTLFADTSRGNRPSFTRAAPAETARAIIDEVVECLRSDGLTVLTGEFGAHMAVSLVNDGPVTILVDVE